MDKITRNRNEVVKKVEDLGGFYYIKVEGAFKENMLCANKDKSVHVIEKPEQD